MRTAPIRRLVLLGCAILCLGALSLATAAHAETAQEFTLGPGDLINISVWNHEELSMEITIGPDGKISYPLLGEFDTTGVTPNGLEGHIRTALSKYLKDPQVAVNMETSANSFAVVGEVQKPGHYDLKPGWHLAEAIAAAGGITETALSNDLTLVRKNNQTVHVDLDKILNDAADAQKIDLQRGDLIIVPKIKLRVSVLGEVGKPGLYDMTRPSARLTDALAMAGGITSHSKARSIAIVRYSGKSPTLLTANLDTIARNAAGEQNLGLCDGDLIYVPVSNRLNWGDSLQAVLGVVSLSRLLSN